MCHQFSSRKFGPPTRGALWDAVLPPEDDFIVHSVFVTTCVLDRLTAGQKKWSDNLCPPLQLHPPGLCREMLGYRTHLLLIW